MVLSIGVCGTAMSIDPVNLDEEYEKFKLDIESTRVKDDTPMKEYDPDISRRDKALEMDNEMYQQKKKLLLERYKKLPRGNKSAKVD